MSFDAEEENAGADDREYRAETPRGLRVGGDSVRVEVECMTCGGVGHYMTSVFGAADPVTGERPLSQVKNICPACMGTGKEWVLS